MPKGVFRPVAKTCDLFRLTVLRHSAKNLDVAGSGFGQEHIAVGRSAKDPRIGKSRGIQADCEPFRRLGPRIFRPRHNGWASHRRLRGVRLREVLQRNVANSSRLLKAIIRERRFRWRGIRNFGRHRCGGSGRADRSRSAHRLDIGDQLPPLFLRQGRPRWHSIFQSAFGDVPEDGSIRYALQCSMGERWHIAHPFPGSPVAGGAVAGIAGFACCDRGSLPVVGIFSRRGRRRCIVKPNALGIQWNPPGRP